MPTITSLAEFRIDLLRIFAAHDLLTRIHVDDVAKMDLEICSLALDYVDGFYRDALRVKAN